ncbi:UNVERIFIED_CONTAM: hypothetical protein GTU68_059366 [Idotea baltica]|nr:hypothetical protein [Idotea baltica]
MLKIRKSKDRGFKDQGWLKSYHTFSFADYLDRKHMHFSSLRVINEDFISNSEGFGTHPHKDMEIITYVLKGELEHKDSMGNSSRIKAGEIQKMSAGSGITHSEFNPSKQNELHLYQIWIKPDKSGIEPSYQQKIFPKKERENTFQLIISKDGENNSVTIQQDSKVYLADLNDIELEYSLEKNRNYWVQVIKGNLKVNDLKLDTSDALGINNEDKLLIKSNSAEIILFDLP